ncbi:unnamed protein product [Sphagnum balticum]
MLDSVFVKRRRRERDKVNVKSTYTTVDEQTDNRKTVPPAWRNRKKKDDMVLEEEHETSNVTFMGEVLDVEESSGQTEDLKDQVAEERRKRHLVTQRLAQQRTEADKSAQQKQEHWDTKYRELQKEKYAMSIRLQSLETAHLASLLAGRGTSLRFGRAPASIPPQRCLAPTIQTKAEIDHEAAKLKWSMMKRQVTEQEVKKLRREIEEQEILIRGYQHENEKALQKLKEAQAEAREQSRIMIEENAMLAAQLAKLQNFANDHQSSNFFLCPISAEDALHDALTREAKLKEQLTHVWAESKKKVSEGESEKRAIEAELEKRVLEVKAEKQELEMQVSQMEAAKSVLEAEVMKRVAHILELSSKLSNCLVAATSESMWMIGALPSKGNRDFSTVTAPVRQSPHRNKYMLPSHLVVNIRIHYVRKVKDLNDKLEESKHDQLKLKLSSENATSTQKPCTLRSVKIRELQAAKDRVIVLEEILNEKDLMIGELHNQIKEINSAANGVSGSGSTASCPLSPQQITNLSTKTKPKTLPPTSPPQSVKLHNDIAVYNELLVTPLDPDQFGDIMFPAAALTIAKSQKLKHLNSLTIHAQESRDASADASGSDVSHPAETLWNKLLCLIDHSSQSL